MPRGSIDRREDSELPPFRWADHYDGVGFIIAVLLGAVLILVGVFWAAALAMAAGVMNISSFALRRRAGVPQVTVWERLLRSRR